MKRITFTLILLLSLFVFKGYSQTTSQSLSYNLGSISSSGTIERCFFVHPEFPQTQEIYQFTLTKTTRIIIDQCKSTVWTTNLYLRDNQLRKTLCEADYRFGVQCDDANFLYATLSPGTYVIGAGYTKYPEQDVACFDAVVTRIQFVIN